MMLSTIAFLALAQPQTVLEVKASVAVDYKEARRPLLRKKQRPSNNTFGWIFSVRLYDNGTFNSPELGSGHWEKASGKYLLKFDSMSKRVWTWDLGEELEDLERLKDPLDPTHFGRYNNGIVQKMRLQLRVTKTGHVKVKPYVKGWIKFTGGTLYYRYKGTGTGQVIVNEN
jgi:hypothetical protein